VLIGRQNQIRRQFCLIFKLKMVQKYRKTNSQKRVLELSKSFLNEMRAFFRFTGKRKTKNFLHQCIKKYIPKSTHPNYLFRYDWVTVVLTWTAIFRLVAQFVALPTFKPLGLLLLLTWRVEDLAWHLSGSGCRVPRNTTPCSLSPTLGLVAIAAAAATVVGIRPLGLLQCACLPFLQAVEPGRGEFVYSPLPTFM
jgi:hypothetical protein